MSKIKTSLILLSLAIVAVFFYVHGSNSNTATVEPVKNKPRHKESRPINDARWYKESYQNVNSELKALLQATPLDAPASVEKEDAYEQILTKAIAANKGLLAGFARQKLAELNPSDTAYLQAGDFFIRQLNEEADQEKAHFLLAKSKELYKKATEQNPDNILANNKLAVSIIQLNEDPPMVGIGYLKKSLSIDSNNLSTNILYGELLIMSGQHEKAIKVYNKLVNLQPSNAEFLFKLSDIHGQLGNANEAKEYLEKAKKLNQQ